MWVMSGLIGLTFIAGCSAAAREPASVEAGASVSEEAAVVAYAAKSHLLPTGYERLEEEAQPEPPLDAVDRPTSAHVFSTTIGDVLVIEGSGDALESFQSPGRTEDVTIDGRRAEVGEQGGLSFVSFPREGSEQPQAVAIFRGRGSQQGWREALRAWRHPREASIAEGDLSPFSDAAPSRSVTYVNPKGEALIVRTFPGYGLDPILRYLDPIARPVELGGRAGYTIDGGNGNRVVATAAPDGTLVLVAATTPSIPMSVLTRVASDLEGER